MKTTRFVLWGLVGVLVVGLGGFLAYSTFQQPADQSVLYEESVDGIGGPFALVNSEGQPVTDADFADKPKVMFFGFTFCPDVCPTTLYELSIYLDQMGPQADNLHAIMVSVDPERDTPEDIGRYTETFSDRIVGLTGSREQIDDIVAKYRVYAQRVELASGDYTIDHTASMFLMTADNELVGTIAYQESPETALPKLERLAEMAVPQS